MPPAARALPWTRRGDHPPGPLRWGLCVSGGSVGGEKIDVGRGEQLIRSDAEPDEQCFGLGCARGRGFSVGKHYFQLQKLSESFHPVQMDARAPGQIEGPVFAHTPGLRQALTLAYGQGSAFLRKTIPWDRPCPAAGRK